eukprot:TRINITY_DN96978_c0_g1_i1.p1 TRINITY_DN96978_c0_g1~~TRINITY_DN96978_c0_g1_i1.p1  ORF type:complete len:181 (-),score=25.25 TRINITY_DN96978_c0_g1_i1:115-657(-)
MGQVAPCARSDELPGEFKEGDVVYYAAASQMLPSGDSLVFGERGEVAGPSAVLDGTDDNRVAVQFPRNSEPVACFIKALAEQPPSGELQAGWRVGECLVYTGTEQETPEGDKLTMGMECEVVGPGVTERPSSVAVLFKGNSSPVVTASLARPEDLQFCPWLFRAKCFETLVAQPEKVAVN